MCDKLTILPVAGIVLFAIVGDVTLVELEFCLDITKERFGIVLAFADNHHHIQFTLFLAVQPHRDHHVHVCGLGMTTRPFIDGTHVMVFLDLISCRNMELRGWDNLTGRFVGAVMREVVRHEESVILPGSLNAAKPLGFALYRHDGHALYIVA